MGDFLRILTPGAYAEGVDLRDCFLHWLAAPVCRRFLGDRRPLAGILGAYLVLPFGLGPSQGWNDKCAKAILSAARSHVPTMHVVDFADDVRLVDASGERDVLAVGVTGLTSLLDQMGVRYHAKEGKGVAAHTNDPLVGFRGRHT